jgi:hypothetical protein
VKLYTAIRRLLAACLIAGLFLAPLTAARSAQSSTCPMMALCMSGYVVEQDAHVVSVKLTAAVVRNLLPASESMPTGLGYAPPSRPPRVQA